MRLLVMVFALVLACAAASMAAEVCPPGTMPGTAGAGPGGIQMAGDEVFDVCFMQSLGITAEQLSAYRAQGMSNADIAIAGAIARKSGQPITGVATQYQLTPNWEQVSQYYQVSMTDLGLSTDLMNKDNNVFNAAYISQAYGTPLTDVQALRSQGYSWGEINLIANASARTGQSVQQIASMRGQGTTWESIATKYNMPITSITTPCPIRAPRVFCCAPVGAGPVCTRPVSPVIYDRAGNALLTMDQAIRYYSMGNDWTNVAIAANIARETGYPIEQVLMDLRSGMTWDQVAIYYGVVPERAFDLSNYPFPRRSIYSASTQERNLQRIERYQSSPNVYGPSPVMGPVSPSNPVQPVQPVEPVEPVAPVAPTY